MDPQAVNLNNIIKKENPIIFNLLSQKGRAIFFPKRGILNQSSQAQKARINATIGIAKNDEGEPLNLFSISRQTSLAQKDVFPYAPGSGVLELRQIWQKAIVQKNPQIAKNSISLPLVTAGVTHGIFTAGFLFIDKDDRIISPDLYWENYDLIFKTTLGAKIVTFPTFFDKGFNLGGLEKSILSPGKKKILILNFPNNPTGFTPSVYEAEKIAAILLKAAKKGKHIVIIIDDAYFGLVYEKGVFSKSIFSLLYNLHKNILCIKVDGATKEDYVWGFRVGFLTFGVKSGCENLYNALSDKAGGVIRSSISNAPLISQSLLLSAYKEKTYLFEKKKNYQLLKDRYLEVKKVISSNHYSDEFTSYPFNSGYFMCVKLTRITDAEKVRQLLLEKYNIGLIAFEDNFRISYSSVAKKEIKKLFDLLYKACQEIQ